MMPNNPRSEDSPERVARCWPRRSHAPFYFLAIATVHLATFTPHVAAFEIKLPLSPGDWLVTRGVDSEGFHKNSYAIDFDDGGREVNALASLSGSVFRVVRDVCDAEGRDVCTYCSKDDESLSKIAVYHDSGVHGSYNDLGNHVIIDHEGGYRTIYAHLRCGTIPPEVVACSSLPPERIEECEIKQGEVLGVVGTSGASSGTHLHLEIQFKAGGVYSGDISVPELAVATMEGRLLAEYVGGATYPSTNRPGIEFTHFDLRDVPNVITSAGFHIGIVDYTIRNNADEPRYVGTIELKGSTDRGDAEQLLDTLMITTSLGAGVQRSESRPVTFEVPENFVGNFRMTTNYSDENNRKVSGSLSDSVFSVTDPNSVLIDDDGSEFFFNTAENVESYPSGGADGGSVQFTYSNFDEVVGTWRPANLSAGRYEVLVYVPSLEVARAKSTTYEIIGLDPQGTSMIRQSMNVNQFANAGRWISLGKHYFDALRKEVTLTPVELAGSFKVGFDAVLFRYSGELDDFDDVDAQDWFYRPVNNLQNFNIVRGRQGNLFEPASQVTRAEMLKMAMEAAWLKGRPFFLSIEEANPATYFPIMFALAGLPYPPFSDVSSGDWFFLYVNLGSFFGIVGGRPDGTFAPHDPTQRVEAMKMIVEAFDFDLTEGNGHVLEFSDISPGEWYIPYVRLLNRFAIVNGYPDGRLRPGEYINRAEAAALIARTLEISHQIERR